MLKIKYKQTFKNFTTSILLFVFGILIFLFTFYPKLVDAQLNQLKLMPQSQPFTELYFENDAHLPKRIKPEWRNSFKFTIHNLENQDLNYPYEIALLNGEEKQVIATRSVSLKNKEKKSINEYFVVDSPYKRVRIEITLLNTHQSIHFWLTTL